MDESRKRAVETTRKRHPSLYKENGKKSHKRGFSDPEVARQAALRGHELRREKRKAEQDRNITDNQES